MMSGVVITVAHARLSPLQTASLLAFALSALMDNLTACKLPDFAFSPGTVCVGKRDGNNNHQKSLCALDLTQSMREIFSLMKNNEHNLRKLIFPIFIALSSSNILRIYVCLCKT